MDELKRLLKVLFDDYKRTYIIVDALDECEATKERRFLLPLLENLPYSSTKLFVTSRPNNEDIFQSFGTAPKLTMSATESDLRQYITERIEERKVKLTLTPDLRDNVVSTISGRASGM